MIVLPPNDIETFEKTLRENDDIAAVILEPTGAHMGLEPILPEFLHQLREVTERYGVVLIFDEVVTGFRVSRGGAQEYFGIRPDMTTLAKILGGGLPGGAVAGKAEIINMIEGRPGDAEFNQNRRIAHNGTFNANPLSAAAGIAALKIVANEPINDTADARAAQLKDGLNEVLGRLEIPGCAVGISSLMFLHLGVDYEGDTDYCILTREEMAESMEPERVRQLSLSLLNHGVQSGNRFVLTAAGRRIVWPHRGRHCPHTGRLRTVSRGDSRFGFGIDCHALDPRSSRRRAGRRLQVRHRPRRCGRYRPDSARHIPHQRHRLFSARRLRCRLSR